MKDLAPATGLADQQGNKEVTRFYITDNATLKLTVNNINRFLETGRYNFKVGFDIETQPIKGLEDYPRSFSNDEANPYPNKRALREYFIKVLERNYTEGELNFYGVTFPYAKVKSKKDEGLPPVISFQGAGANALWSKFKESLTPLFNSDINPDLDSKLINHLLNVIEDKRKTDPVEPGLDPYTSDILTLQFTFRTKVSLVTYVVNANFVDLNLLESIFKNKKLLFIGANIKFDLKFLYLKLGYAPMNVFCTRIADRMLTLGLMGISHSLASCVQRYLNITLDKKVREQFIGKRYTELSEEQINYAATDTEILMPLYDAMVKIIESRNQGFITSIMCKQSLIRAVWEVEGYKIDLEKWLKTTEEVNKKRDFLASKIQELLLPTGYKDLFPGVDDFSFITLSKVNIVKKYLAERLTEDANNLLLAKFIKKASKEEMEYIPVEIKVDSLSKINRDTLDLEYKALTGVNHPFFNLYDKWSKVNKQSSTYGEKFLWNIHPLTGLVHPSFNIGGADSFRDTSSRPNFLNIPVAKNEGDADFRSAFLAPEGFLIGDADYADAEGRIMADITGDKMKALLYASGKDGHTVTAALVFHMRRADVLEMREVKETFKYGTDLLDIIVVEVPRSMTDEEMFSVATSNRLIEIVTQVLGKATRTVAKTVTFLYAYGGSWYTLSVRNGFPEDQAKEFFKVYNSVFKGLSEGLEYLGQLPLDKSRSIEIEGRLCGYAEAYGNLRRYFSIPYNPSRREYANEVKFKEAQKEFKKQLGEISRKGKNFPAQAGNAAITMEALLLAWEYGEPYGIRPWFSIYDEILFKVPDGLSFEVYSDIATRSMLDPSLKYLVNIPFKTSPDPLAGYWKKVK